MAKANKLGQMDLVTREIGAKAKCMARANSRMPTATATKGNSKTTSIVAKGFLSLQLAKSTTACGNRASTTARGQNFCAMAPFTPEILKMAFDRGTANTLRLAEKFTRGSGTKIAYMAKGSFYGQMGGAMSDNGKIICCMATVSTDGLMANPIMANIVTIVNTGKEQCSTRMGLSTKAFGSTASSTAKAPF